MEDLAFIRKHITKEFLELIPLIERHKKAQIEMRKSDRRIKTFETKYNFIESITKIGASGDILATAIKRLLKETGFTKVVHFKDKRQKTKREDLQAHYENDLFIIEVKGLSAPEPKRYHIIQIIPYVNGNINRYSDKSVYGLTILNLDNAQVINNRKQTFKNSEFETDLINSKISCISIIDLLLYFRDLKKGIITFEELINELKKYGLLTYGSKGGKTLKI